MRDTTVRWAESDGTSIAYEVFGTGPIDLLLNEVWSPIDLMWELPQLASFLDQLGAVARVIVFDGLGSGAVRSALSIGGRLPPNCSPTRRSLCWTLSTPREQFSLTRPASRGRSSRRCFRSGSIRSSSPTFGRPSQSYER